MHPPQLHQLQLASGSLLDSIQASPLYITQHRGTHTCTPRRVSTTPTITTDNVIHTHKHTQHLPDRFRLVNCVQFLITPAKALPHVRVSRVYPQLLPDAHSGHKVSQTPSTQHSITTSICNCANTQLHTQHHPNPDNTHLSRSDLSAVGSAAQSPAAWLRESQIPTCPKCSLVSVHANPANTTQYHQSPRNAQTKPRKSVNITTKDNHKRSQQPPQPHRKQTAIPGKFRVFSCLQLSSTCARAATPLAEKYSPDMHHNPTPVRDIHAMIARRTRKVGWWCYNVQRHTSSCRCGQSLMAAVNS